MQFHSIYAELNKSLNTVDNCLCLRKLAAIEINSSLFQWIKDMVTVDVCSGKNEFVRIAEICSTEISDFSADVF